METDHATAMMRAHIAEMEEAMRHPKLGPRALDPTSAWHWLPRVQSASLPMPRTIFVNYCWRSFINAVEGGGPRYEWPADLREACESIGYPAFLRTDMGSAKHDGPSGYLVTGPDALADVASRCAYDALMKDRETYSFMVREFLRLESPFAAFGGLPIANERRVFAERGRVLCEHFYWPEYAIKFWQEAPEPEGWRDQLAEMAARPAPWVVMDMAERASSVLEGAWSVDFARDVDGKWWLIDMACAESSWHPEHETETPTTLRAAPGKE